MARAVWNGKVIAESDVTETVEGNVYFPESSLKREYFRPSTTTSTCPWKGQARYMSLLIDGNENPDAAWYWGNNTASWNPTVAVHVPAQAVGGTYDGTLTQSVS